MPEPQNQEANELTTLVETPPEKKHRIEEPIQPDVTMEEKPKEDIEGDFGDEEDFKSLNSSSSSEQEEDAEDKEETGKEIPDLVSDRYSNPWCHHQH
jgi:hypothetical protein